MFIVNPIKAARLHLGYSQVHFAKNCGTSKQLVIRAEQGCYPDIPPAIFNYLRFHTKLDLDSTEFRATYCAFQHQQRKFAYGMLEKPYDFLINSPSEHPFIAWREYSNLNQTQVAKNFCVHPSVLFKFEKQPHLLNDLPEQLVDALLDSGYAPALITELRTAYRRYKDYLASEVNFTYGTISDSDESAKLH